MIELPDFGAQSRDLLPALLDIADAVPDGWLLVGGQMVLSLVADLFEMRALLTAKDRQRLKRRVRMNDESHRVWRAFDADTAANARASLRVLQSDTAGPRKVSAQPR
jgi:hypothetical protein